MKILLIEDSKVIRKIIKKALYKYEIIEAETLKKAKNFIQSFKFDIIILDLALPNGNGKEILDLIDKNSKVIIITNNTNTDIENKLYKKGITTLIPKTLEKDIFLNQLIESIKALKQKNNLLIIDKNKNIFEEIKKITNHQIIFFNCQENKLIKNREIDLILINLQCKNINDILKIIKKLNITFPYIPIIGIFNSIKTSEYGLLRRGGVSDFIKYPFTKEEVILKIDSWLDYVEKLKAQEENIKDLKKSLTNEIKKNIQRENYLKTQARKAQLGEMLAIIAHQLKQPLNHINISNYFLKEFINGKIDKQIAIEATQQIDTSTKYLAETIDTFKNFFKDTKKRVKTTLKKIIEEALLILKPLIEINNIQIDIIVKEDTEFFIFKNDLIQVIINLIKNAIEALIENKIKDPKITIIIENKKLIIKDNAGGIPQNVMKKLFKPYVSTKGEKGTGLGLYMSKMIVEDVLNGKIKVYNDKEGAVFEIIL